MSATTWNFFVTLLSSLLVLCIARGPHHPRGEVVVKRHTHYRPTKDSDKITEDESLLHDKEHIQEHLEEVAPQVDLSKMTEEELELYYFLLHDSDKDSRLDGLELLNAILHTTHQGDEDYSENSLDNSSNTKTNDFEEFVELVDQVLREEDKNQDGYLDYTEYVDSRKRAQNVRDKNVSVKIV
ncbi:multiple coagulation factor deficiency protein 2 homolog [Sitophilus oryzae]|uniref:Multiple coagulation factor deficiency protein 2 homolog n=1 Tax=Sitophilus oryzae TaxID=7048 RepID=A0A6J2YL63_SITOR|nr:multiple coagulation factor deficiency protein 2 homolog [Sitophilus oryzae]